MDEKAYERLLHFYCHEWFASVPGNPGGSHALDPFQQAFNAMISPDILREERESFFKKRKERIAGISLQKDRVMPFSGVEACMGDQTAKACFEVVDFPFDYTHETPFPMNGKVNTHLLEKSFLKVFRKCAAFLA